MLQINTTQNVKLNFQLSDVGTRIVAFVIDFIILLAYFYFMNTLLDKLNLGALFVEGSSINAISTLAFIPMVLYSLILEIAFGGQTVGKMIMKLKVVKIDGFQASNVDFIIRWFFRLIDVYGFIMIIIIAQFLSSFFDGFWNVLLMFALALSPIAGLITMVLSKNRQRFGDMVAGTTVISLKNKTNISHTILEELKTDYKPTYASVIKLSDNDVRIIKETFIAAKNNKDFPILIKLRDKIEEVTGIRKSQNSDIEFIETILKDYNFYTQNM